MIEKNAIIQIIFAAAYLLACLNLGVFILRKIQQKNCKFTPSALTFTSLAFVFGAGIISSLWLLLALSGLFKNRIILPVLAVCIVIGAKYIKQLVYEITTQLKHIWWEARSYSWSWQVIIALNLTLLILGMFSMVNWGGDAVAFYLAVPKVVAHTGRLSLLRSFEGFMSVGLQAEMHSAYFMKTGEPVFLKLFSGISSAAMVSILMGISGEAGLKRKGKWLVLAAYITSSAIYMSVGDGKPDIIAASLGVAAYYLAFTNGPVILIGILCGLAGTMKMSYLGTMFPGIAYLIIWNQVKISGACINKQQISKLFKEILIKGLKIGAWCLLAALPHIIKNGLLLNAPFAPLGMSGIGWMDQNWFGPETTRRLLLLYPFALTWGDFWAQGGNLSPLLIAFFPLNIFLPKKNKMFESPLFTITFAGLIGMCLWFLRYASVFAPRYYLATLLMFFPIGISGVEHVIAFEKKPKLLKFLSLFCVFATLISVGINSVFTYYNPAEIPESINGNPNLCNLDWEPPTGFCVAENEINRIAEPGSRVYLASWYRYWLNPDLIQCTNGISDIFLENLNSEDLWIKFYERGFEYLIIDGSRPQFDPETQTLPSWMNAERLNQSGLPIGAYKIEFNDPPHSVKVKVDCIRNEGSAQWELIQK
jgi:hypothetical protein